MLFNSHNSDNIEIRPRFKLVTKFSNELVMEKVKNALPKQNNVRGVIKGNHLFLKISEQEEHYWSPAMEVVVEKHRDNPEQSYIRCLIGPKQTVWMMLMFFYIGVGVLALFGGMYGLVKWNLGKESIFIWAFPAAIFLFAVIYFTSKYGQRKGRDQMLYLVSFLYHAINDETIERF